MHAQLAVRPVEHFDITQVIAWPVWLLKPHIFSAGRGRRAVEQAEAGGARGGAGGVAGRPGGWRRGCQPLHHSVLGSGQAAANCITPCVSTVSTRDPPGCRALNEGRFEGCWCLRTHVTPSRHGGECQRRTGKALEVAWDGQGYAPGHHAGAGVTVELLGASFGRICTVGFKRLS